MDFLGTLLPFHNLLQSLISLFAAESEDEDETEDDSDDQDSDKGNPDDEEDSEDEEDDEEQEDEDDEDEDEEDDEDELSSDELTRRNAARLDSKKDLQLTASMEAFVDVLIENPDVAEDKLEALAKKQPELAAKIAKMYKNRQNNKLGEMLEKADDAVKAAFRTLLARVDEIEQKTEEQIEADEKRVYKSWMKEAHPYLNPKSKEGSTPIGKKLRATLYDVLDERFSEGALSEDTLEDALAIAKRRVKWNDNKVSKAVKKQAIEQAAKGRTIKAASGGKGVTTDKEVNANEEVAEMFGDKSKDRLKKVAAAKKKAGYK